MKGKEIEIIDPRAEQENFRGLRRARLRRTELHDSRQGVSAPTRGHLLQVPPGARHRSSPWPAPVPRRPASAPLSASTRPSRRATPAAGWTTTSSTWSANTEKGEKLLGSLSELLRRAERTGSRAAGEDARHCRKAALHELDLTGFRRREMLKLFELRKWKSSVRGLPRLRRVHLRMPHLPVLRHPRFQHGQGIKRFRCWDSCMYSDFTKMASGNPA